MMSSDDVVKIAWQENNVERQVSFVVKPQATPPPTNLQQQQQQLQLQPQQQLQQQPQQQPQQISLAKITKRRKTVTAADELMRIARQQNQEQEMETLTVTVETEPEPGTSQQQQDSRQSSGSSCLIRILKRRQSYVVRTGPENTK